MGKSELRRRIAPSVPFTIEVENDGGPGSVPSKFALSFRLAYDLNAIAVAERQLEKERGVAVNLLAEIGSVLAAPSVRETTVLLWAALQLNHEDWTGEDGLAAVRSIVTLPDLMRVHLACTEAFLTQLPADRAAKIKADMEGTGVSESPLAQSPAVA